MIGLSWVWCQEINRRNKRKLDSALFDEYEIGGFDAELYVVEGLVVIAAGCGGTATASANTIFPFLLLLRAKPTRT